MADTGEMSVVGRALLDFSSKWILPIVMAFSTWQYTEIGKLEERVNVLQRDSVTHAVLQVTETRWNGLLDLRIKGLEEKQEITNGYLRQLIGMQKK